MGKIFWLDSGCPGGVILCRHVRAIYGGKGFQRAYQTGRRRHGAGAVLRAALQHRADANGGGDGRIAAFVVSPNTEFGLGFGCVRDQNVGGVMRVE